MTDASLDDFFAKKDKSKKGKSKGKYTTSELITKKFEESGRKCAQNDQTSTSNNTQGSEGVSHKREDDDEWNDFELEKEKDYSGLRIQALSIADREKEEELAKDQQPQENGEDNKTAEANVGPWKISGAAAAAASSLAVVQDAEPLDKEEEPPAELAVEETPKAQTYRPPQMRYSQSLGGSGGGGSGGARRHGRNVPEIDSELHFPSLSQAAEPPKGSRSSDGSFQSVKHGLRSKDDAVHQGVRLDLGNKYSALDTN